MSSWGSYPSIFNIGHRAIRDLFTVDVNVEEKVDGSQFSFGLIPCNKNPIGNDIDIEYKDGHALKIRSKGCVMHIDAPEKMFNLGAQTVRELADQLTPGWTYRGEFLAKPKHNSLVYDRVPAKNIILFDINTGDQGFLSYEDKVIEANRLGLEIVPRLFEGRIDSVDKFRDFLDTTSVLGGQKIEGVVIKPKDYSLYGLDKKVLMGKYISEQFREAHSKNWKEDNPSVKDIISKIGEIYTTTARWQKALIHLREKGLIADSVTDIGSIIKEVPEDIRKEHEDEMKEMLFAYAWPHIRRQVTRGLPDWYKESILLPLAFDNTDKG